MPVPRAAARSKHQLLTAWRVRDSLTRLSSPKPAQVLDTSSASGVARRVREFPNCTFFHKFNCTFFEEYKCTFFISFNCTFSSNFKHVFLCAKVRSKIDTVRFGPYSFRR